MGIRRKPPNNGTLVRQPIQSSEQSSESLERLEEIPNLNHISKTLTVGFQNSGQPGCQSFKRSEVRNGKLHSQISIWKIPPMIEDTNQSSNFSDRNSEGKSIFNGVNIRISKRHRPRLRETIRVRHIRVVRCDSEIVRDKPETLSEDHAFSGSGSNEKTGF
jgi:hypothetical protein